VKLKAKYGSRQNYRISIFQIMKEEKK